MKQRRRRNFIGLEAAEGFIDTLFLLLTFFIVQNVWQVYLNNLHNRFMHAQKLDLIKGLAEGRKTPPLADEKFILITISGESIWIENKGITNKRYIVLQNVADPDRANTEHIVYNSTLDALRNVLGQRGYIPDDILASIFFKRDATIRFTVGVYDALNRLGFKKIQWGAEGSL